jgi:hypothetical protein
MAQGFPIAGLSGLMNMFSVDVFPYAEHESTLLCISKHVTFFKYYKGYLIDS